MSRLNINNLTNENEDGAPKISGISTFSSTHYFVPPSGSTAERPSHADPGMIRFNTDSGHLEYYNGVEWTSVIVRESSPIGGRGLFGGGGGFDAPTTPNTARIDYVTIATTGNGIDFGDLTQARSNITGCSSPTRGVFGGGYTPTFVNTIDYVQIMSTGNAIDFGDMTIVSNHLAGCSNGHGGL